MWGRVPMGLHGRVGSPQPGEEPCSRTSVTVAGQSSPLVGEGPHGRMRVPAVGEGPCSIMRVSTSKSG